MSGHVVFALAVLFVLRVGRATVCSLVLLLLLAAAGAALSVR